MLVTIDVIYCSFVLRVGDKRLCNQSMDFEVLLFGVFAKPHSQISPTILAKGLQSSVSLYATKA
jgi:hypothetical protein